MFFNIETSPQNIWSHAAETLFMVQLAGVWEQQSLSAKQNL